MILSESDFLHYGSRLIRIESPVSEKFLENKTAKQDIFEIIPFLPSNFVDLLFLDPPYNLDKNFNAVSFKALDSSQYLNWLDSWLLPLLRVLKRSASVYICGDWRSASAIQTFAERHLKIRNRITWEREKGRGAQKNWKNCSEDIWFCTVSNDYYFDPDSVKLKRRVVAPYKKDGVPKDWEEDESGGGFRLTSPSNLWTDLTVPFWAMPENTFHPTQKPEKLLAKIILASSRPNDFVFDPFLGSGTCSVVAKKLGRRFFGVELDHSFACLAEKRIEAADADKSIQGYSDGIFWDRNARPSRIKAHPHLNR